MVTDRSQSAVLAHNLRQTHLPVARSSKDFAITVRNEVELEGVLGVPEIHLMLILRIGKGRKSSWKIFFFSSDAVAAV